MIKNLQSIAPCASKTSLTKNPCHKGHAAVFRVNVSTAAKRPNDKQTPKKTAPGGEPGAENESRRRLSP
jgi:hypothetical protein